MHRWLFLLLIALLPLRGWVADSMAGDMLQAHLGSAAATATATGHHAGAGDCMDHGAPVPAAQPAEHGAMPHGDAQPQAADGDCPTCATCQACSSVALGATVHLPGATRLSQAIPPTAELAYFSAEPATVLKPPIS